MDMNRDRDQPLNFLHAWELGANLGHVGIFAPVAKRLLAEGHQVTLASRETGTVTAITRELPVRLMQAPYLAEMPSTPPVSYPDILLRFGLGNPKILQGHVEAWRAIFELTDTDLVVADHAPTALIAARTAKIPVMLFNSGFFVPPREAPLPALRPWNPIPRQTLVDIELQLLNSVNQCLVHFGAEPIRAAWELFDVAESTLLGFPEFDHYDRQGKISYWGYVGNADMGEAPTWPGLPGKKIFAYLRANAKHFTEAVNALINARQPTLLYCPDAPPQLQQNLRSYPHILHVTQPINLIPAAREADLLVTYAAFSTTAGFIHAGKPCLLLPGHLEQFLFARRVEECGFGLVIHPDGGGQDVDAKLHQLLNQSIFRQNCQTFSQRYTNFPQATVLDNILRRMLEMASQDRLTPTQRQP